MDCNTLWRLFAGASSICISESVEWCATDWIKFHSFNDCTTWGKGFCITPVVTIGPNDLWRIILSFLKVAIICLRIWHKRVAAYILIGQLTNKNVKQLGYHAKDVTRCSQLKLSIDICIFWCECKFHKNKNEEAPSEWFSTHYENVQ